MKFYRGSSAAARAYVEADHSRADDYYLAEGSGVAERLVATLDTAGSVRVKSDGSLDGDAYERWVAGLTPDGRPKGRLRTDDHALRFVEVVINGPKTWSLAASVDPVISAAYDAAQDRAVAEIVTWLGQHSTTRVGPRGLQVQIPTEQIEAAVVRHYTSRTGDPHRHLHLQINARVWAAGKWRGLHTAGTTDQIEAINGIGHAAIACDPEFRATLRERGYTLDPETGEITELVSFAPRFSARAAQIARNVERNEAEWRTAHPGEEPGAAIRQSWDRRAWAQARPDKVIPADGAELVTRWRHELADLGFTPPPLSLPGSRRNLDRQTEQHAIQAGEIPRTVVARQVITKLGAAHSAWNAADIRGAVEKHIAAMGLVASSAVRVELVEDITARALASCVPLIPERGDVPEHIRSLTSPRVLEVEEEIISHLAARGEKTGAFLIPTVDVTKNCTHDQEIVVSALAGTAPLVVVEGAAGAGKTFTLRAAACAMREHDPGRPVWGRPGKRLLVIAPTQKAAQVASAELREPAFSAAKFIHNYGYRWNERTGDRWREPTNPDNLSAGERLRRGDLLVIDEAGMLDQDTTLALLEIADEQGARVAFIGDRHQLAAVGRGGVLDHAIRHAAPGNAVTLDTVHRFADPHFARLTLEIRGGFDAGDTFDELLERGHIKIHRSEAERTAALTTAGLAGETVIAESLETVDALNHHIQDARPTHNAESRQATFETQAGQSLRVGDQVATRRNNRDLDLANRERWHITHINTHGRPEDHTLTLTGARGTRTIPASYARADLELAYATTVHGAQGDTVDRAHFALTETSTAAATYVGLTRGRENNTVHIVAETEDAARDQWETAFNRDRADLGPRHARNIALENLERYGPDAPQRDARIRPNNALDLEIHNEDIERRTREAELHYPEHIVQLHRDIAAAREAAYRSNTSSSHRSSSHNHPGPTQGYGPSR